MMVAFYKNLAASISQTPSGCGRPTPDNARDVLDVEVKPALHGDPGGPAGSLVILVTRGRSRVTQSMAAPDGDGKKCDSHGFEMY